MKHGWLRLGSPAWMALLVLGSGFAGCASKGGGNKRNTGGFSGTDLNDPVLVLEGPTGRYSMTPAEAVAISAQSPIPVPTPLGATVTTDNHWFRLTVPFDIQRLSVLDPSGPFGLRCSGPICNLQVTDGAGNTLPGLVTVNGLDANGTDRSQDVGFPIDLDANGNNRNVGAGVLLFIADADDDLSTIAAFGFTGNISNPNEVTTSTVAEVQVRVREINQLPIDGLFQINIDPNPSDANPADVTPPQVVGVTATGALPSTDPLCPNLVDVTSGFVVEFSEPVLPPSVARSAVLQGSPFGGNVPIPFVGGAGGRLFVRPFPNVVITATTSANIQNLFIPFDVRPLNSNNLSKYLLTPLVDLPPSGSNPTQPTQIDVAILANTTNSANGGLPNPSFSVIDPTSNGFDGTAGSGTDLHFTFCTSGTSGFVNAPVSPEVIYFLPGTGRGIGAVDLNGGGFTTNTPGANANRPETAAIITRWTGVICTGTCGTYVNAGGWNPAPGLAPSIATIANPAAQSFCVFPDPCGMMCPSFSVCCPFNAYLYGTPAVRIPFNGPFATPVGLGGYSYGRNPDGSFTPGWQATGLAFPTECPMNPGNPGTALPGVNEGSSGFETLVRDSRGRVILTQGDGQVGRIEDLIIGDFLDRVFHDTGNFAVDNTLHVSRMGPAVTTLGSNLISDPPSPNPPPLRYWLGLPALDVVIDQSSPTNTAFVIEGEEVFSGRVGDAFGYVWLRPNKINPLAEDDSTTPHFPIGPGLQSGTAFYTFSSRQQIGNFLYATDVENRVVHAINSNNMRVIESIPLPDPTGLGISPSGDLLFVTNFSNDSLSIVDTDPDSPNFHTEIARIKVGTGPRAVSVQPDNEDIMVCNFLGDSISIVDQQSLTVRKTVDALINGPFDIAIGDRQLSVPNQNPFGFQNGIWFAYISNFSANSVVVFESGPDGPQGIGYDNVLGEVPTGDNDPAIIAPRGLTFSAFANPQNFVAGGCFVAHQDDRGQGRVSHIQFTQQAIIGVLPRQAPPGFFIPPGFLDRNFEVTDQWGGTSVSQLAGTVPTDVTLADMNFGSYGFNEKPIGSPNLGYSALLPSRPEELGYTNSRHHMRLVPGTQIPVWNPDRVYVSFADTDVIQVLDPIDAGTILNTIEGNGGLGVKKLTSFWHQ